MTIRLKSSLTNSRGREYGNILNEWTYNPDDAKVTPAFRLRTNTTTHLCQSLQRMATSTTMMYSALGVRCATYPTPDASSASFIAYVDHRPRVPPGGSNSTPRTGDHLSEQHVRAVLEESRHLRPSNPPASSSSSIVEFMLDGREYHLEDGAPRNPNEFDYLSDQRVRELFWRSDSVRMGPANHEELDRVGQQAKIPGLDERGRRPAEPRLQIT
ncbi:hypothetical protein CEK25_004620 [Fusarium fujikuroi]|nr:hypothetical protein CEK25_004620 [Fusarium fujikuroi]